mmetsp:Transcript_27133/g.85400  ORF Transcript_27133/g.85400 Transcript_27133/m.85400 type:complete len:233 (+) Transcript_27133:570-1268(+)
MRGRRIESAAQRGAIAPRRNAVAAATCTPAPNPTRCPLRHRQSRPTGGEQGERRGTIPRGRLRLILYLFVVDPVGVVLGDARSLERFVHVLFGFVDNFIRGAIEVNVVCPVCLGRSLADGRGAAGREKVEQHLHRVSQLCCVHRVRKLGLGLAQLAANIVGGLEGRRWGCECAAAFQGSFSRDTHRVDGHGADVHAAVAQPARLDELETQRRRVLPDAAPHHALNGHGRGAW